MTDLFDKYRGLRNLVVAIIVLSAHGLALAFAVHRWDDRSDETKGGAIVVELSAITTSPTDERLDVAVGKPADEATPVTAVPPAPPPPLPVVEPPLPPLPALPAAPSDIQVAKREPADKTAMQDEPPPRPQLPTALAPKVDAATPSEATAPRTIETASLPDPTARSPPVGLAGEDRRETANWQRDLVVHLNRFKRYPVDAGSAVGMVTMSVALDRSGRIVEARVAKSSGNVMLDAAAIAMVRRASPLPAPPSSVPGDRFDFTLPTHFTRKK